MADKRIQFALLSRGGRDLHLFKVMNEREGFDELNTPKFTAGDTGLSYRVISHWAENNILPTAAKKGKGWHKFTLTEMVWLKIVIRLRNFGFSIRKIAEIKEEVMSSSKKGTKRNYPFLDCYITHAWVQAEDSFIIILADGSVDMGSSTEIDLAINDLAPNKRDMLLISLKGILQELGIDVKKTEMRLALTKETAALLKTLSSTAKSQSEVSLKIKQGRLTEIESTETLSEAPDFTKINQGFKEGEGFGEVTTQYVMGKPKSARVKKRQRFK